MGDVQKKPITWFQSQICQTLGYPEKMKPAVRGISEIAKSCIGQVDVVRTLHNHMQVSPKIGVSHLQVENDLTEDVIVLELYLLLSLIHI